ncbi:MAG: DsbA family oxidoreductase [Longimicrobiaceae bacterium]
MSEPIPVVLFADFVCPFSYVTEQALRKLAGEGVVRIDRRAFELFPEPVPLPAEPGPEGWRAAVLPLAGELGLEMGDPPRPPRTRKAHELARWVETGGGGWEVRAAIYHAHFARGKDIGRIDTLLELAGDYGLDQTEAKVILDLDRYAASVEQDREEAGRIGVRTTPALIAGHGANARLLTGARSYRELSQALLETAEKEPES